MASDAAIVEAATWTAAAAAAYLAAGAAASALRSGSRAGGRALAVAVAVALVTGGVGVGLADDGPHRPVVSATWPLAVRPSHPARVVVHAGDSLWVIAASRLAHPHDSRVAMAWPRWWRTNRDVIGGNPDLIHPGQRLRPPRSTPRQPTGSKP